MNITDDIRNYNFTKALPSELIKISREYYALATLKYICPSLFSELHKGEAPDLQDSNGTLGVEVTWGGSPRDELISGESVKYSNAKTKNEKEKCRNKIRRYGGDRDEISTSYPASTADDDKYNIKMVFAKKLKKIGKYRKSFEKVGLVILMDIPLLLIGDFRWGEWLSDVNNENGYDFVILLHWSGVDMYDFKLQKYFSERICREDMDGLKKIGRLAAEGIIKDDDPVWQC